MTSTYKCVQLSQNIFYKFYVLVVGFILVTRCCQVKGFRSYKFTKGKQCSESYCKSCLLIFPKIYRNVIIQFTRQVKAEVIVLLNYD
jgi:predicted metal-binding protein